MKKTNEEARINDVVESKAKETKRLPKTNRPISVVAVYWEFTSCLIYNRSTDSDTGVWRVTRNYVIMWKKNEIWNEIQRNEICHHVQFFHQHQSFFIISVISVWRTWFPSGKSKLAPRNSRTILKSFVYLYSTSMFWPLRLSSLPNYDCLS